MRNEELEEEIKKDLMQLLFLGETFTSQEASDAEVSIFDLVHAGVVDTVTTWDGRRFEITEKGKAVLREE